MGRGAQRFAFAYASPSQEPSRSSSEHAPPPRPLYALLRLYRSRGRGSALSGPSSTVSAASEGSCGCVAVRRAHLTIHGSNAPVLGTPAAIKGSELLYPSLYGAPALPFAPPGCPKPSLTITPLAGRIIPDDMGSSSPAVLAKRGGAMRNFREFH